MYVLKGQIVPCIVKIFPFVYLNGRLSIGLFSLNCIVVFFDKKTKIMKTILTFFLALLTAVGVSAQGQTESSRSATELLRQLDLSHLPPQSMIKQKWLNMQSGSYDQQPSGNQKFKTEKSKMSWMEENPSFPENSFTSKGKLGTSNAEAKSLEDLECLQTLFRQIPIPDIHMLYTSNCDEGLGTMTIVIEESDNDEINAAPIYLEFYTYDENFEYFYDFYTDDAVYPGDTVVIDAIPLPDVSTVYSEIYLYGNSPYEFVQVIYDPCDNALEFGNPLQVEISEIQCPESTFTVTFLPGANAEGFNLSFLADSSYSYSLVPGIPISIEVASNQLGNPAIYFLEVYDGEIDQYNYSEYYFGGVVGSGEYCEEDNPGAGADYDELCEATSIGCGTTDGTFIGARLYNWDGYEFTFYVYPKTVQWYSFTADATGSYRISTCGEIDEEDLFNSTATDLYIYRIYEDALLEWSPFLAPYDYYECSRVFGNWAANYDFEEGGTYVMAVQYLGGVVGDMSITITCPPEPCYGAEVLSYNPGNQKSGQALPANRTDATKALGEPQNNDTYNFVTLGYGGELIIGFNGAVNNLAGDDFIVVETTFGPQTFATYPESADIYVTKNGIDYYLVGTAYTNEEAAFDISDAGIPDLDYITAVKFIDTTPLNSISGDGFEVDGVISLQGCEPLPVIITGECFATETLEYIEGTSSNGGAIAANRTNPEQALGEPEGTDTYVFTTLGYGGSITLAFTGAVLNGAGDDFEVVETSFGTMGCSAYKEYADVSVSEDGVNFYFAKTVCKSDNMVDINDAGAFSQIYFIKVENNDVFTLTPDGFDLDGIRVLNCGDEEETGETNTPDPFVSADKNTRLSSFPNPTPGISQVVFQTESNQHTLLEVYDMSGRSVASLYNAVTEMGVEYRINFDGSSLPNGIYVYRLTSGNELLIDKFMIAR